MAFNICYNFVYIGIRSIISLKGQIMSSKLEITCPCCETKLQVDQKTGEVLWKEEKKKEFSSLTDMVHDLAEQQKESQSKFQKQKELEKDKARILAEKFKEAQKNVDKSDSKPLRDFDLD